MWLFQFEILHLSLQRSLFGFHLFSMPSQHSKASTSHCVTQFNDHFFPETVSTALQGWGAWIYLCIQNNGLVAFAPPASAVVLLVGRHLGEILVVVGHFLCLFDCVYVVDLFEVFPFSLALDKFTSAGSFPFIFHLPRHLWGKRCDEDPEDFMGDFRADAMAAVRTGGFFSRVQLFSRLARKSSDSANKRHHTIHVFVPSAFRCALLCE